MHRIRLTDEQRKELNWRAHQSGVAPSTRDRLEMVRLGALGWSIPRIAKCLEQHEQTVRRWVKSFLADGFNALVNKPRGGRSSALTPEIMKAVYQEVAKAERTWTAPQLADWVVEHYGVRVSVHRMRFHLRGCGLSYQRSSYTIDHKQKPEEVQDKKASIETLKKGGLWAD